MARVGGSYIFLAILSYSSLIGVSNSVSDSTFYITVSLCCKTKEANQEVFYLRYLIVQFNEGIYR